MPRKAFVASAKPKEGPQAKKITGSHALRVEHPLGHIIVQIPVDKIAGTT